MVPECAIDSKAYDDETKHGDEIDAIKNDGDVGDPLAGEAISSGVVSQGIHNDGSTAAQETRPLGSSRAAVLPASILDNGEDKGAAEKKTIIWAQQGFKQTNTY